MKWTAGRPSRSLCNGLSAFLRRGVTVTATVAVMWRRRRLPPQYEEPFAFFSAQAGRVEAARSALLSCLPVGRVDPAPVPVGLDLVDDELRAVDTELDAWWVEAVDAEWRACRQALHTALAAVPHARSVARSTGELEELLDAVGEVVEPLDDWQAAERRWASLRTR